MTGEPSSPPPSDALCRVGGGEAGGAPSPADAESDTKRGRGWVAAAALGVGVLVGYLLVASRDYDTTVAVIEVARVALAIIAVLAIVRIVRRAIQHSRSPRSS